MRRITCSRACHAFAIATAIGGVVLALHAPGVAGAQEWRFEPELRVGAEYDDNARLRAGQADTEEIDGYILEGSADISYLTPRTTFTVTPRIRSRVYDEEIDVDSDDQFLDVDWAHEMLKGSIGLDADYSRESVRTAERADADVDLDDPVDIPTDATGIVFGNQRRERLRIVPRWSHELTERMAFGVNFAYTDTAYDDAFAVLRDYTDKRLTANLSRELTQRTNGYLSASARRFESEFGNDVDGYGVRLGFESEISQTTTFQAEAGVERTEQEATGEDTNLVGGVSLIRRLETTTLLAQYRRNVVAGGTGRVTARDTLNLNANHRFTERVSGSLGFRAYQTDSLDDQAIAFEERDYMELFAELEVALSLAFSVEAEYRHGRIERTGAEGSADSNSIILWLVYRPTRFPSPR